MCLVPSGAPLRSCALQTLTCTEKDCPHRIPHNVAYIRQLSAEAWHSGPSSQHVADARRTLVQESLAQSWRAVVTRPGCMTCRSGSTTSALQTMACTTMSPPGSTGGLYIHLSTTAVRNHPHLSRGTRQQARNHVSARLMSTLMLKLFA